MLAIWRETLIDAAIFREAITNMAQGLRSLGWHICFVSCSIGHEKLV